MSSEREFILHSENLPKKSYPFFEDFRRKGILCDITFKVGNHSVSAHRIVLAAGIPFFRDVICNDAATQVFEIPEIDYSTFEALIEFVYSCKITITLENVKDLLSTACALQMEEVREACCKFLKKRLDTETVMDIRHLADKINCLDLAEVADHYIRKNFDRVSESESFLNFSFSFLEELIRKGGLQVSSEEKVFECILRWVKNAPAERSARVPELLKNVRLAALSPRYLSEHVATQEFIRTSIPCRDLLDEAKNYHLFPEKQQEALSFRTDPRTIEDNAQSTTASASDAAHCVPSVKPTKNRTRNKKRIYKIETKTVLSLRCFNLGRKEWYEHKSKTMVHEGGSSVQVNNKVYLFFKDFTLEYDPPSDDIKFCAGSVDRLHTCAAVLGDIVYVCGGKHSAITNCAETFDPQTKEWSEVSDMISRRMSAGAVTLEECVYVLGGLNKYIFRSVEKYSAETQTWTREIPMLTRRYDLGCATLNDQIYVCGGMESHGWSDTAEVFNPVIRQWKFISPMCNIINKIRLISHRGKIYAFGVCSDGEIPINAVEILNPETQGWLHYQSEESGFVSGALVIL